MQLIDISLLENNTGQINGVNTNPRNLTDDGFKKAVQSIIKSFPEMLELRSLVVVPHGNKYVVIGGNQRLRALQELRYSEAPCVVAKLTTDQINEFIIKDNLEYGDWDFDLLATEWESDELTEWGLDIPLDEGFDVPDEEVVPDLAAGERQTMASMEFTLSVAQKNIIDKIISETPKCTDPVGNNENRNGNALFYLLSKK